MKFDTEAIPLVHGRRPRRHVVLEHVALGIANLPVLADVDVRGWEIAGVPWPRAVEAPDRVDDAVAARLHKRFGGQISGVEQIIQIPLI